MFLIHTGWTRLRALGAEEGSNHFVTHGQLLTYKVCLLFRLVRQRMLEQSLDQRNILKLCVF